MMTTMMRKIVCKLVARGMTGGRKWNCKSLSLGRVIPHERYKFIYVTHKKKPKQETNNYLEQAFYNSLILNYMKDY